MEQGWLSKMNLVLCNRLVLWPGTQSKYGEDVSDAAPLHIR
jgi:hypothetical protein